MIKWFNMLKEIYELKFMMLYNICRTESIININIILFINIYIYKLVYDMIYIYILLLVL